MITASEARALFGKTPRIGGELDPHSYLGQIVAGLEVSIKGLAPNSRETTASVRVNGADEKQLQRAFEDAGFSVSFSEERELTQSDGDRRWVEITISWW